MDYVNVVERGAALIAAIDAVDRVLLFNSRCEEATGIARDVALGRSWLELFIPLEDRPEMARRLAAARAGETVAPFTAAIAVEGGRPRCIRWELTILEPAVVCAMGVDVTGDEEAALRCRRAERMAALGTMTAGLAHELKNPLNAAHLQLDLARRRLGKLGETHGALEAVEVASAEMSRLTCLVDEFLAFARPGVLRLAPGDLRAVAAATTDGLRAEASTRSIELVLEPGAPVLAEFDCDRMTLALHHLVRNGIEAAGSGGRVRVVLSCGDRVAIVTVEDTGPGLPAGAPVFEPFYTTKPTGTGLGLAVAHRIASDHGGSIAVDSRSGLTRFALSVPAT